MKHTFSFFAIFMMALALPQVAKAYDYTFSAVAPSGQTLYYNIENGGAVVTYPYHYNNSGDYYNNFDKPTGSLVIPDSVTYNGTTYAVTSIGHFAFNYCDSLTSVTIPNSVTGIGNCAFYYCFGLTSVTIPNSVTSIRELALSGCSNLTSIVVESGNNTYDSRNNCNAIIETATNTLVCGCNTTIIPNTVTSIGHQAFSYCYGLTSVTIPNSVTSIGDRAFCLCSGLTSVTIPNSVTSIGDRAFAECYGLTSVTIPNTVTSIGDWAFYSCSSLTSVTIPNSVSSIGDYTFRSCFRLTSVTIPNSVTSIGSYAFEYCSGLTSITIPNSVISIGDLAFCFCSGLTSVTIGNSVTNIGSGAFYGCNNIATANYNAVNCQANGNFQNLANLTTLNIGDEVQYIQPNTFSGCTGLVTLNVPDAVTEIGSGSFQGCSNLTSATFGDGLATIGSGAFSQCTRLTSVSFGEGIANIGDDAFNSCGIIGELVIPQSLISIGNGGFNACYGITEITCLGRVAPTLGTSAFGGVDTSITVNIPCGTTNLYAGRWAYFHNFNEVPFLFNVESADITQGTVAMLQEPSCDDPVAIVEATPRSGYRFDHWSDGSTQNPYTYTAMGSLTLTAYFAPASSEGIGDIMADGINVYSRNGHIVVDGTAAEVRVYDIMGRLVASTAGKAVCVPVPSGVYLVKVGQQPARKVVVMR